VIALEILLFIAAVAVLLPAAVLFTEIFLALWPLPPVAASSGKRARIAVLMPAHDESLIIASSVRSVLPQLSKTDRLLVVADNCTDDTAQIAAGEGAEVIERTHEKDRGKGYALNFGVRHLESDAPDIVLIVDADCHVADGSIDILARQCERTHRPIQANYLMRAHEGAAPNMRLAEFAWLVKNRVRPLGLRRLGLPCHLMGTGMAFPWQIIRDATLATGHIVEDLKLGLDLARDGAAPLFCPDTLVSSYFPISTKGVQTQRTRWEHGHLSVILSEAPSLILGSLKARSLDQLALALDLCVPPLALLMLATGAIWISTVGLYFFAGMLAPFAAATLAAILMSASVVLGWVNYGRQTISFSDLMLGFLYPIRKISVYFGFLFSRQVEWVRSKRNGDHD
jgi:cellulose synthase/poly-beta-1,6-N-acetylglucosamine synthase-like glycosyltransferase